MVKNNWKFFANRDCEFYPCHKGIEELNCLQCYCPIFWFCGTRAGGGKCEECLFPHDPKMHDAMQLCIKNLYKRNKI